MNRHAKVNPSSAKAHNQEQAVNNSHNASPGELSAVRGIQNRSILNSAQLAKLERAGAALPLAIMEIYDPRSMDPSEYVERILGIIGCEYCLEWDERQQKWVDD
jgi:hypothetical protein